MQREKENKPPLGTAHKPPSSLAKSGAHGDIAILKSQLNRQQTEISEMKRMLENLVSLVGPGKVADSHGKKGALPTTQCSDEELVDFGCQVETACPHCGTSPQMLSSARQTVAEEEDKRKHCPMDSGRKAGEAVQEKVPSSFCVVSQTERQFVNEMIKAARKWLQNDENLDDLDEVPSTNCGPPARATRNSMNSYSAHGRQNVEKDSGRAPVEFPAEADDGSLSVDINALAMRYLEQNPDEPTRMHQRRGVHFENPNYTLTRRQQVVTEEVSMGGIGGPPEVSLSSREYLERHGIIGSRSGPLQQHMQQSRFVYNNEDGARGPPWYSSNRPQMWPQYEPECFDQYDNACYRRYRNC
uniref:Uncharacterized protein n=1 Tax=Trichuris muris TaxID=70415 RepID=A0A5S6QRG9_TRIMR